MRAPWALVVVAGCADASGILVEVRAPIDDPGTPVDEAEGVLPPGTPTPLRLYAGVASGIDPLGNPRAAWWLDDDPDTDPATPGDGVTWPDTARPFRALLEPTSAVIGAEVFVLAHARGTRDAGGGLAAAVKLSDDLVTARLQLVPTPGGNATAATCVADPANQIFFDHTDLDCDDDRWAYPYDCADTDRGSYPMYYEKACCNRDRTAPVIVTELVSGEICEMTLTCDAADPAAAGWRWETDKIALCNCARQPDLVDCALAADYVCTVRHEPDGTLCGAATGQLFASAGTCAWHIVGRIGSMQLAFSGGLVANGCAPAVTISRVTTGLPALSWAVLDLNGEPILVRLDAEASAGCLLPAVECRTQ